MDVVKVELSDGKCNFCERGTLMTGVLGLSYPYSYVYRFNKESGGLTPNICEDCLLELNNKIKLIKKK